ncbi:MAG: hypothetical protein EXQ94_09125 [Alphaproteobacteria bacterium]|nr:hypothetical protein [Alphaproteobacteria bacterium]
MTDIHERLRVRRVVNGVGTWTLYGASLASSDAVAATAAALGRSYVMAELHEAASRVIAEETGAEAGCVVACSAAGITLAVAAAMAGDDFARVRALPDTTGMRDEVVMLKGHVVDFGADVRQMVRLAGARVVEVGTATFCHPPMLAAAFGPRTAAAFYVVSHLCVLRGMPTLLEFVAAAHAANVPVVVDAAAEYDLRGFIAAGADLVIHSAHKFLQGPTAGILSGRRDLVRAVAVHQASGIGRPMKVGKEGVIGALAALDRWRRLDHAAERRADDAKLAHAARILAQVPGIATGIEEDTTGNPLARLRIDVDPESAGLDAEALGRALRGGDPVFATRDHLARLGYILLDPRSLDVAEVEEFCRRVREIVADAH